MDGIGTRTSSQTARVAAWMIESDVLIRTPSKGKCGVTIMHAAVVVEGTVQSDGTLEVTQKVALPAGRVQVTVQPVAEPVQPDRFWTMMESIWAAQRLSGRTARTREEIDAEIEALRSESEDEMQAVERLQEECRRAREQDVGPEELAD